MAIIAAKGASTAVAKKENLFVIPSRVYPLAGVVGFADKHTLASFKGNCIRGARFGRRGDPLFWETPEPMTIFAVSFVHNNAKNNAEMQQQGRQKKPARHLRILHVQ